MQNGEAQKKKCALEYTKSHEWTYNEGIVAEKIKMYEIMYGEWFGAFDATKVCARATNDNDDDSDEHNLKTIGMKETA